MTLLQLMDTTDTLPELSGPDPANLISGDPVFTSWDIETAPGGISAGRWQTTPGKWYFENTYWEYFRIISGVSILTEEGQEPVTLRAGDSVVLRDGFKGIWECVETTLKDYVIRE